LYSRSGMRAANVAIGRSVPGQSARMGHASVSSHNLLLA
jgi:hypothetical protein